MARRQQRNMEGDEEQRRAAAREARRAGKSPSAEGKTLGASKQRASAKHGMSHQERLELRDRGKQRGARNKPRPGNRDTDPKRTNRWE